MTRPGEPRPDAASMLRVNQAGEYGATRIYAGQLAVLRKDSPAAHAIAGMARQEERHLERFNALMAERRRAPDPAPADLGRRRLRAWRGDRADGRESGDGLHRRGRDRDRPPLWRAARRAWRQRSRRSPPTSPSSAPRSSSIRPPRARMAPPTRSAYPVLSAVDPRRLPRRDRAFETNLTGTHWGGNALSPAKGHMMSKLILTAAAASLALPGSRSPPRPALAQRARVSEIIVYGTDPCPRSTDDDVVVCARRPEAERFRIPEVLRETGTRPGAPVVDQAGRSAGDGRRDRHRQLLGGRPRRRDGLRAAGNRPRVPRTPRRRRRPTSRRSARAARFSFGALLGRDPRVDLRFEHVERHRALPEHGVVEAAQVERCPSVCSARARNSRILSSPNLVGQRLPRIGDVAVDLGLDIGRRQRAIVGHEGDRLLPCVQPLACMPVSTTSRVARHIS